uniref:Myb/SANT-like DNA-binding domain-containing protein n=1 Tax=Anopheles atroparvus TaxID=41427 RepID=A0AAG5CNE6_ANOAO
MKQTAKRHLWTYDETLEMLNIMVEQESLKAMNGRPFRKEKAFRLIQEEMVRRGYRSKDAKQIEYRWKNIKKRYVDIQKNPDAEEDATFQYYDEIDLMLNGSSDKSIKTRRTESLALQKVESILPDVEEDLDMQSTVHDEPTNTSVDETFCEDVAMEEEVVEEPAETSEATQRRSQRSTRGKNRRYNTTNQRPAPSQQKASEDEVYRNHKRLLDYQFGLYSRLQRESDEKFLQMSREMLIQCNVRFETFVTEVLAESELA